MPGTLLIVGGKSLPLDEVAKRYIDKGWEVTRVADGSSARELLLTQRLDPLVVVVEHALDDGAGEDLLAAVRAGLESESSSEWIFLVDEVAEGAVAEVARTLKAHGVLSTSTTADRLDLLIAGAARAGRRARQLQVHSRDSIYTPESFVGRSVAARRVRDLLNQLCAVPWSSLVLEGPTGTGKGLVARILHYSGGRARKPLVEINCAAIPVTLLESELFGHEHGAFTGAVGRRHGLLEMAHGGTLFLDEIGTMDAAMQAKLLTAIEDRRFRRVGGDREVVVDLQVIAASNEPLARLVAEGSFRADLFHRLHILNVTLPPLSSRLEDLDDLVPSLVAEFVMKLRKRVAEVPAEVMMRLRQHNWPGNVRELRNVIERCVLMARDEVFPAEWLQLPARSGGVVAVATATGGQLIVPLDGSMTLDQIEKSIIEAVLEMTEHNTTAAARRLGATRETLRYRIAKYGLAGRAKDSDDD